MILILAASIIIFNPACAAARDEEPTQAATEHLIAFLPTFAQTGDTTRFLPANLLAEGWEPWIMRQVDPVVEWGARRVVIHLPFGRNAEEPMDVDGYVEARARGMQRLVDSFAPAWTAFRERHPDVELIFYTGTFLHDTDFVKALDEQRPDLWLARGTVSVYPFLSVRGAGIALDKVTGAAEDHPTYRMARLLESLTQAHGGKVYVEGMHLAHRPHWWSMPVIVEERQMEWGRNNPGHFATDEQVREASADGGEIILLATHGRADEAWIHETRRNGYTPLFDPRPLIQAGVTYESLHNAPAAAEDREP